MPKKKNIEIPVVTSGIPEAVKAKQDGAMPRASASKYYFDFESGSVQPKGGGNVPDAFKGIRFEQSGKGDITAYVPQLAVGGMSWNPGINDPSNWNAASFGAWGMVDNDMDGKMDIRRAIFYWKTDPLVYKCVKLLTQLANSSLITASPNDDAQGLVENWMDQAMPTTFRQQWFREYFVSGLIVSLKSLIPYVPRQYKDDKVPASGPSGNVEAARAADQEKAVAEKDETLAKESEAAKREYEKAVSEFWHVKKQFDEGLASVDRLDKVRDDLTRKQYRWTKGSIPGAYTILDPLTVEIAGPLEIPWLREPFLYVTGQLAISVNDPVGSQNITLQHMPQEIVSQVKAGYLRVWLSPNICNVSVSDKQGYERYPTPIVSHAFKALDMKEQIYLMDLATVHSVKNRILKVTIGNDMYPEFNPDAIARLQKTFFANPGKNSVLFWNHTLELEWIEPKLDSFKDTTKYEHWNNEIRTVFGITKILTGTSETSGAASVMNFKGVEEMVREAQSAFLNFLQGEIRLLKSSLNIAAPIEVKFDQLNLKDEVMFWGVINQAVLNGLIDHETALETLRFHFPTIVQRMKKIKKLQEDEEIFLPMPSANNMGPEDGIPTGGKPKKSPSADNNKNKKGKSQPKTKAKAKIVAAAGGDYRVIVDRELDAEEMQSLAEMMEIDSRWVMTVAQYKAEFGKDITFTPPLPELSTGEYVKAIHAAQTILKTIPAKVEELVKEHKERASGKRGAYTTERLLEEKTTEALCSAYAEILKDLPDGKRHDDWDHYVAQTRAELFKDMPNADKAELDVTTWTIVAARCQKTKTNEGMKP